MLTDSRPISRLVSVFLSLFSPSIILDRNFLLIFPSPLSIHTLPFPASSITISLLLFFSSPLLPSYLLLIHVDFMAYSATLMDYLSLLEQRLFSEGLYEIGGQMRPTQLLGYLDAVYGERLGQPLHCPHTVLSLLTRVDMDVFVFSVLVSALIVAVSFILYDLMFITFVSYSTISFDIISNYSNIIRHDIIILSTLHITSNSSHNIESPCLISQWHFKGSTCNYRDR
jgi:hypothetical protein